MHIQVIIPVRKARGRAVLNELSQQYGFRPDPTSDPYNISFAHCYEVTNLSHLRDIELTLQLKKIRYFKLLDPIAKAAELAQQVVEMRAKRRQYILDHPEKRDEFDD